MALLPAKDRDPRIVPGAGPSLDADEGPSAPSTQPPEINPALPPSSKIAAVENLSTRELGRTISTSATISTPKVVLSPKDLIEAFPNGALKARVKLVDGKKIGPVKVRDGTYAEFDLQYLNGTLGSEKRTVIRFVDKDGNKRPLKSPIFTADPDRIYIEEGKVFARTPCILPDDQDITHSIFGVDTLPAEINKVLEILETKYKSAAVTLADPQHRQITADPQGIRQRKVAEPSDDAAMLSEQTRAALGDVLDFSTLSFDVVGEIPAAANPDRPRPLKFGDGAQIDLLSGTHLSAQGNFAEVEVGINAPIHAISLQAGGSKLSSRRLGVSPDKADIQLKMTTGLDTNGAPNPQAPTNIQMRITNFDLHNLELETPAQGTSRHNLSVGRALVTGTPSAPATIRYTSDPVNKTSQLDVELQHVDLHDAFGEFQIHDAKGKQVPLRLNDKNNRMSLEKGSLIYHSADNALSLISQARDLRPVVEGLVVLDRPPTDNSNEETSLALRSIKLSAPDAALAIRTSNGRADVSITGTQDSHLSIEGEDGRFGNPKSSDFSANMGAGTRLDTRLKSLHFPASGHPTFEFAKESISGRLHLDLAHATLPGEAGFVLTDTSSDLHVQNFQWTAADPSPSAKVSSSTAIGGKLRFNPGQLLKGIPGLENADVTMGFDPTKDPNRSVLKVTGQLRPDGKFSGDAKLAIKELGLQTHLTSGIAPPEAERGEIQAISQSNLSIGSARSPKPATKIKVEEPPPMQIAKLLTPERILQTSELAGSVVLGATIPFSSPILWRLPAEKLPQFVNRVEVRGNPRSLAVRVPVSSGSLQHDNVTIETAGSLFVEVNTSFGLAPTLEVKKIHLKRIDGKLFFEPEIALQSFYSKIPGLKNWITAKLRDKITADLFGDKGVPESLKGWLEAFKTPQKGEVALPIDMSGIQFDLHATNFRDGHIDLGRKEYLTILKGTTLQVRYRSRSASVEDSTIVLGDSAFAIKGTHAKLTKGTIRFEKEDKVELLRIGEADSHLKIAGKAELVLNVAGYKVADKNGDGNLVNFDIAGSLKFRHNDRDGHIDLFPTAKDSFAVNANLRQDDGTFLNIGDSHADHIRITSNKTAVATNGKPTTSDSVLFENVRAKNIEGVLVFQNDKDRGNLKLAKLVDIKKAEIVSGSIQISNDGGIVTQEDLQFKNGKVLATNLDIGSTDIKNNPDAVSVNMNVLFENNAFLGLRDKGFAIRGPRNPETKRLELRAKAVANGVAKVTNRSPEIFVTLQNAQGEADVGYFSWTPDQPAVFSFEGGQARGDISAGRVTVGQKESLLSSLELVAKDPQRPNVFAAQFKTLDMNTKGQIGFDAKLSLRAGLQGKATRNPALANILRSQGITVDCDAIQLNVSTKALADGKFGASSYVQLRACEANAGIEGSALPLIEQIFPNK